MIIVKRLRTCKGELRAHQQAIACHCCLVGAAISIRGQRPKTQVMKLPPALNMCSWLQTLRLEAPAVWLKSITTKGPAFDDDFSDEEDEAANGQGPITGHPLLDPPAAVLEACTDAAVFVLSYAPEHSPGGIHDVNGPDGRCAATLQQWQC